MRDAWADREGDLAKAISNFKTKAQNVFGNVFIRKKKILARLLGTQRALAHCPNSFLINIQKQLSEEYNLILELEEELWAMKSRTIGLFRGRETQLIFISLCSIGEVRIESPVFKTMRVNGAVIWRKLKKFST